MTDNQQGPQARQGGEQLAHVTRTPLRIWAAVFGIVAGFMLGGLGLILHSVVLVVAGGVVIALCGGAAMAMGIMENTH